MKIRFLSVWILFISSLTIISCSVTSEKDEDSDIIEGDPDIIEEYLDINVRIFDVIDYYYFDRDFDQQVITDSMNISNAKVYLNSIEIGETDENGELNIPSLSNNDQGFDFRIISSHHEVLDTTLFLDSKQSQYLFELVPKQTQLISLEMGNTWKYLSEYYYSDWDNETRSKDTVLYKLNNIEHLVNNTLYEFEVSAFGRMTKKKWRGEWLYDTTYTNATLKYSVIESLNTGILHSPTLIDNCNCWQILKPPPVPFDAKLWIKTGSNSGILYSRYLSVPSSRIIFENTDEIRTWYPGHGDYTRYKEGLGLVKVWGRNDGHTQIRKSLILVEFNGELVELD